MTVSDPLRSGLAGDGAGAPAQPGVLETLLSYRRYILTNAIEDLRQRYAGTGLGVLWNVVHPLAMIAIFSLVFSQIMPNRFKSEGGQTVSFLLYLCSGLLPWLALSDCLGRVTGTFIENAGYLKKLAIPELVFAMRTAVSSAITLGIYLVLLIATAFLLGHSPHWAWLLMAPAGLLMIGLGFGLGLCFGTLNVFFRDIAQMIALVLQLWMWLTPIIYSVEILPPALHPFLWLNPFYPFVHIFREIFLFGTSGGLLAWGFAAVWATGSLLLGRRILAKLAPELRDVL